MKRNTRVRLFLIFATGLILNISVFGDMEPTPYSYSVVSSNQKFVFVMLSPDEKLDQYIKVKELRDIAISLRRKYQISGLYLNDQSSVPLWTIDWYSFDISISSDGHSLVRFGNWASKMTDEAFSFFRDGMLLKTYRISDVIRKKQLLRYSVSHFVWKCVVAIDQPKDGMLTVTTVDRQKFIYKLTDGNQIDRKTLRHIKCPQID